MASNDSETQSNVLKLLSEKNNLTYNWALYETIRLMEQWIGRDEGITNTVISFAAEAAIHLSGYEWTHYYEKATVVRLELFLRAMSSALCIASLHSQSDYHVINKNTRAALYKSISKFWAVYRNTKFINANIMFTLREIRNCLRKIKDDQSSICLIRGWNVLDIVVSVLQKEYLAAFRAATCIKDLDFEYSPGKWYMKRKNKNENYFRLRRKYSENNSDLKEIIKFYERLHESMIKEFETLDVLYPIGYLDLVQQLLMEFLPQMEKGYKEYLERTILLCYEIVNIHVNKQLTFKAVEVLYVIKENSEETEIKNEIESNFEKWIGYSINIVKDVKKLFIERHKLDKNIKDIEAEYNKLLKDENIDKDSMLPKLQENLLRKEEGKSERGNGSARFELHFEKVKRITDWSYKTDQIF